MIDRARLGRWLFVATLIGAACAGGAVELPVLLVVTPAILVALVLTWPDGSGARRRGASLVGFTFVGLAAWTVLQAVPLPAGLANALSGHGGSVWAEVLRPLGEAGPIWHPLSVDPHATWVEALRWATYAMGFFVAHAISANPDGGRFLERAVLGAAVAVALAVAVHWSLHLETLWGIYVPRTATGAAPLVNANHLAGYVNVGIMIAASSALAERPLFPRPILAAVALLLVASEIRLASRGGVGTMVVGLVLIGVVSARRGSRRLRDGVMASVAAAGGVAMIVLAGFEEALHGLRETNTTKLHVVSVTLKHMAPAYWLTGCGRGGYESAFPEFRDRAVEGFVVFTHPENVVAQWVVEWGFPVAIVAFGVMGWVLRPSAARGAGARGAWVALLVLFLQNLVDFSLEVPAVALLAGTCVAIVVTGDSRDGEATRGWSLGRSGAIALATIAAIGAFLGRTHDLVDERTAIFDAAAADVTDFDDRLHSALLAHPAEPYFPYVAAARATAVHPENVVAWANRTLERSPIYGPIHLVLARFLRRRSPAQSRVEYLLARSQGAAVDVAELAGVVGGYEDALEVVGAGVQEVSVLDGLSVRVEARLPATASRIDDEILRRDPGNSKALLRRATRLVHDAVTDDPPPTWCAFEDCAGAALAATDAAARSGDPGCQATALAANVRVSRGDSAGAIKSLEEAESKSEDQASCLSSLADIAIRAGDAAATTRAVDALAALPCDQDEQCAENLVKAARLEQRLGHDNRSVVFLRRAVTKAPERVDVRAELAAAASRAGLHREAHSVYVDLQRLDPTNTTWPALASREDALTGL